MKGEIQKIDLVLYLKEHREIARNMISDGERLISEGEAMLRLTKGIRDEFELNKKDK